MGFWLRWFSILLGAISLFSLAQKLGHLDLAPIFKDMLNFYRAMFHPIADTITSSLRWVLALVSIKLPQIPADVIVMYFLIGATLGRLWIKERFISERENTEYQNAGLERVYKNIDPGLLNFYKQGAEYRPGFKEMFIDPFFVIILWPRFAYNILHYPNAFKGGITELGNGSWLHSSPDLSIRKWSFELMKVIITFLSIFGINAYFTY
jgi:hypothetical protein